MKYAVDEQTSNLTFRHGLLRLGVEHEIESREGRVPRKGRPETARQAPNALGFVDRLQGTAHAVVLVNTGFVSGGEKRRLLFFFYYYYLCTIFFLK